MTREELLRVLSFVDSTRALLARRTPFVENDPRWNIISYAMRRHLEGKRLTITSLAMAADAPYGTGRRRVEDLIDEGLLLKRARSKTGKSFSLHPTRAMIQEFEAFAAEMKATVGETFGFSADEDGEDFFFGGSYMASRILSYPSAMRVGIGYDETVRVLSPVDPTFKTLNEICPNLDELCGGKLEIVNLSLDALREEIIANNAQPSSRYHLVAVDLPWLGELAEQEIIRPIDALLAAHRHRSSDFHSAAWRGSQYAGAQYAIPMQPTVELLFCRRDLLRESGLEFPRMTTDALAAARGLHRGSLRRAGIVMNYGRGTPVAHTFLQTLASFGQPIIALSRIGEDFDVSGMSGDQLRPQLDTDAARETAEYLMQLRDFAHPESLRCSWDRRIALFANDEAAMTYGWSIRAATFELDAKLPAHGKVAFGVPPHGPNARPVAPIGGFSFAIPTNLGEERIGKAWKVMEYLTRPELMKWYVRNGALTSPRFSTSADPEVQSMSDVISTVDSLERRGEVQIWPRPPIPEFNALLAVLGTEIHDMLSGQKQVRAALDDAQNRIDAIMRARGRYK